MLVLNRKKSKRENDFIANTNHYCFKTKNSNNITNEQLKQSDCKVIYYKIN